MTAIWMAGATGLATVASMSVTREVRRRESVDDSHVADDFTLLDLDRASVMTTADGVSLAVKEVGPADPPLTVVFAHGFCMSMGVFHFQRARLEQQWGDQVRMVFYDHRGHGQSAQASTETYTVGQLGRDLEDVLAVTVPRGPVVLVGHSMGGMTILSHARQFPQHYGSRVVGAALISTAAEDITRSPLGEVLRNPTVAAFRRVARRSPKLIHQARDLARSLINPILRTAAYGGEGASPAVMAFSERMIHSTPIDAMVEFLPALQGHDERGGLEVLAKIPTMVACGDRDLLMLVSHSREMAAALSDCELVIVPGAAHLALMEQPEVINDALVRLVKTRGRRMIQTSRPRVVRCYRCLRIEGVERLVLGEEPSSPTQWRHITWNAATWRSRETCSQASGAGARRSRGLHRRHRPRRACGAVASESRFRGTSRRGAPAPASSLGRVR